jgi:hypothetical protein
VNEPELDALRANLVTVATLAGKNISGDQIVVAYLHAPHEKPVGVPAKLLYVFLLGDKPLKVGSALARARLPNNYNPDPRIDSLASRILQCKEAIKGVCSLGMHTEIDQLGKEHIQSWMERNLALVTFRFDKSIDPMAIDLFEVFLQCKLRPLFEEGWGSLKKQRSIDPLMLDRLLGQLEKSGPIKPT